MNSIHGIPIVGKIPEKYINTLKYLEELTEARLWKGLKSIYINEYEASREVFEANKHDLALGNYLKPAWKEEGQFIKLDLFDKNKNVTRYELFKKDLPAIAIEAGFIYEEYWFAVVLLHELGHHVNREKELKQNEDEYEVAANLFALKYLEESYLTPDDFLFLHGNNHWEKAWFTHQENEIKRLKEMSLNHDL